MFTINWNCSSTEVTEMSTSKAPKREPVSQFVQDAIIRETIKKENEFQVEFEEFHPSFSSLSDATPDKPLVSTFFSKKQEDIDEDDPEFDYIKNTVLMNSGMVERSTKGKFPQTTSQEYGWLVQNKPVTRNVFDYKHKKTDVTMLPSRCSKCSESSNCSKETSK